MLMTMRGNEETHLFEAARWHRFRAKECHLHYGLHWPSALLTAMRAIKEIHSVHLQDEWVTNSLFSVAVEILLQRRSGRHFRHCLRQPSAELVTAQAMVETLLSDQPKRKLNHPHFNVPMHCARSTPVNKPFALGLFSVSVFHQSHAQAQALTHKHKHTP